MFLKFLNAFPFQNMGKPVNNSVFAFFTWVLSVSKFLKETFKNCYFGTLFCGEKGARIGSYSKLIFLCRYKKVR